MSNRKTVKSACRLVALVVLGWTTSALSAVLETEVPGRVFDETQVVRFTLTPAEGRTWAVADVRGRQVVSGTADAKGALSLGVLPAGYYRLTVSCNGGETATVQGTGSCGESAASCACNTWSDAKLLLWDYDTKEDARPSAGGILQLDRIFSRAGDSSMVEVAFRMDGMKYAGFGYAAKRNGQWTVRNLAGFCAGVLPQACTGPCDESDGVRVWSICADEASEPDLRSPTTTAYGKWTMDWSPTVYYRVQDGKSLIPGPAWDDIEPVPFGVVP